MLGIHSAHIKGYGKNLLIACKQPAVPVKDFTSRRRCYHFLGVLALCCIFPLFLLKNGKHKKPYAKQKHKDHHKTYYLIISGTQQFFVHLKYLSLRCFAAVLINIKYIIVITAKE